jgi:hypothetical protein
MRLPGHDRWQSLGGVVAAIGLVLIAGQFGFVASSKHTGFLSPLSISGIVVTTVGLALAGVGFFMSEPDTGSTRSDANSDDGALSQRIGYRVRGKVNSRNARIRNQDIAVDVHETGEFNDENTDIE